MPFGDRFEGVIGRTLEESTAWWPDLPRDSDVLTEQILDRDRLLAVRAGTTDTDPAHEGPALLTPLLADGPGTAAVAFVDGEWLAELVLGHHDGRPIGVPAPSVGGRPARVAAVSPATDRRERVPTDGAGHRDAVVTRRGFVAGGSGAGGHDPASPTEGFWRRL